MKKNIVSAVTAITMLAAFEVSLPVQAAEQSASRVDEFMASSEGLEYKYTVDDSLSGYDKFFAVYDKDGRLKAVTKNKDKEALKGDFADCTFKLMVWDNMNPKNAVISELPIVTPPATASPTPTADPTVTPSVTASPIPSVKPTISPDIKRTVVTLNPSDASPFNNGRFEGWGTSLCWWANRLGYSEKLTQAAATAFFSEDGLGLDIARYNLGGGDDPTHNHVTRSDSKVPGVWSEFSVSEDGKDVEITKYDITKDQNQLNIAKAALAANPNLYFEGFSNSAPYFMTNSGCTSGAADANTDNLNPDMYDDFGRFIADATLLFKNEGIEFKSYSPMNEPDTNYWGLNSPKQEGCHFDPGNSQSKAITETRKALDEKGLTDVLVAGMDETSIDKSVTNVDKLSTEAKEALGRLDTHTYSGSKRAQLKEKAQEIGKTLWMSEVDKGGNGAVLADMIITDMNGMQPAAWVMWDIVDLHKDSNFQAPDGSYPEKNNSLSYTGSVWGVGIADHDNETLFLSNKYYTFGQFSRYINPGDTIIASSQNTLAAYNKDTGAIKIVANNNSSSTLDYEFDLSGFVDVGDVVKEIRTDMSGNEKWAEIKDEAVLNGKSLLTSLKANTVTTYVIEHSGDAPDNMNYAVILGSDREIKRGSDVQLSCATNLEGNVEWSVDNDEIASVSSTGMLTAKKPGTIIVTAKIGDITVSKRFDITVYVNINGSNSISVGKTTAMVLDTNAEGTPVWSVNDTTLAAIDQNGILTALSAGTVDVTVTIGEFSCTKTIELTLYKLSGTKSWGNSGTAPSDSADYLKAVDGDLNTYFDGVAGGYVMYDYGTPYKITSVNLAARSGNGMAERTKGAKIQGSNDNVTWTDLYTLSEAIPAGAYTTVNAEQLNNNYAYRYFRYINESEMANIAEFIIKAEPSKDTAANEPTVDDIAEFTDDFEGASNIFGAAAGDLSADGNQIYKTELARFNNVFMPVKATAAALNETVRMTDKNRFRITFNMFSGWESGGKNNTFAIKSEDDSELVGFTISGGGYNLNQMRIGGVDLLADVADKPIIQCKSNEVRNGELRGANGWQTSSQKYANNMGLNKTVTIIIDGTGKVTVSMNGGASDVSYEGVINTPINIKELVLTGDYNTARGRTVSYDNFDADFITYAQPLETPAAPTDPPAATNSPVLPDNDELINMNFDNGDLSSSSSYGKAEGSPMYKEIDGRKCIYLDGTAATVVTLLDANGNSLLSNQKNITVSFKVKPTVTKTSWWLFAAPNDNTQNYQQEKYLGCMTNSGTATVERYSNNGSRSATVTGSYKTNEWNDVIIQVEDDITTLYINGVKTQQASSVDISSMLGSKSVAYIGRANWGSGEYAEGYIDDFVIKTGIAKIPTVTLEDLSDIITNLYLPETTEDGYSVSWTSSDPTVIANDGTVNRQDDTKTVTLTAEIEKDGSIYTQTFTAIVLGYLAATEEFTAYSEGDKIIFKSGYINDTTPYKFTVELFDEDNTSHGVLENCSEGNYNELPYGKYTIVAKLLDGENVKSEVHRTIMVKEEQDMQAYLFVHFVGTESNVNEEQIYFSVSEDGITWKTLKNNQPVLTSNVGEGGVRDPYILRGEDGKFFIIATDLSIYNRRDDSNRWGTCQTSGSKNIVIWESDDLINWSEARLVKVAPDNAGCTWAPEAVYDTEENAYMVFWASKTSDDNYATQRMYRSYTTDFITFTEPELYIDGGNISNIDTTITNYQGMYYRFTKNESKSTVTMMQCPSLSGNWETVSTYTLDDMTGYEGPTIYKLNGENKWCLLLDYYSKSKGYMPFVTEDIASGNFVAASGFNFDTKYRHGTVMPITQAEYDSLAAAE